jgi:hypothetical protein
MSVALWTPGHEVDVGPLVEDLRAAGPVPLEDLVVAAGLGVAVQRHFDRVGDVLAGVVDERPVVVDDQQVVGPRVARGRRRAAGDVDQFVEPAVERDVPRRDAVEPAGRPGEKRLFDLGDGDRLLLGDELHRAFHL